MSVEVLSSLSSTSCPVKSTHAWLPIINKSLSLYRHYHGVSDYRIILCDVTGREFCDTANL